MKKLTLITMLFVLFLGTRCQALESARAAFFGKHECHAIVGSHASRCKILSGDTLSKDALAVYGDWHLYSTILMGANPQIVDANKIYAGSWISIPDTLSEFKTAAALTTSRVQSHAIASVAAHLEILKKAHSDIATESVATTAGPSIEPIVENFPLTAWPLPLPETVAAKASPILPAQPTFASLPTSNITGYKLVIPEKIAAATGIPLGVPLVTHYNLYLSETAQGNNRPIKYVRLKKNSFARKEGNNIVLYVPLTSIPTQPFSILVAGVNDPIDGKLFVANAQSVKGKLPGQHNGLRTLVSTFALGGSGYILAAAFGPIAGSSVVIGAVTTRAILRHHANTVVENAEKEYNAALTQGTTPSKEIGQ